MKPSRFGYLSGMLFIALVVIPIARWWDPTLIPWTWREVWSWHDTGPLDWLVVGLPLFGWSILGSLINYLMIDARSYERGIRQLGGRPTRIFAFATLSTCIPVVAEEISFRWIYFLGSFALLTVMNFLFFGFAGFGVPEWLHNHAWGPLADFTTLGYLRPQIFHETGWLFGASVLLANAFFRDGHKAGGWFGWINSWFIGMYFFYVMFTCGLLASILVHFLYNVLIFAVIALIAAVRKR